PEKEEGEAAGRGCRTSAGEQRRGDQPGAPPQRAPHQLAAATVLISIVCSPPTMRWVPVTVTLLSANLSSFEFWGSPGLELTGTQSPAGGAYRVLPCTVRPDLRFQIGLYWAP